MDDCNPRQSNSGASDRRTAAIATLLYQYGGVSGAVRRIVYGWHGKFSSVQISIALQRRWPLLTPNEYQVEDCLEDMERQGIIECVLFRHTKLYQRLKHETHHPSSRFVAPRIMRPGLLFPGLGRG